MAEENKLDDAFETQIGALKPDFNEISKESLEALFRAQSAVASEVEVFDMSGGSEKSGMSSGIVIFKVRVNGGIEDCVLRYAPLNNPSRIFAEYDIEGQFHLHRLLNQAGLPVPKPLCYDVKGESLPLPGFVMERIEGEMPDNPAYTSGLFGNATPEQRTPRY